MTTRAEQKIKEQPDPVLYGGGNRGEMMNARMGGGGLPIGAFGGSNAVMGLVAPDGPVYQAGTLGGNPVAAHVPPCATAVPGCVEGDDTRSMFRFVTSSYPGNMRRLAADTLLQSTKTRLYESRLIATVPIHSITETGQSTYETDS